MNVKEKLFELVKLQGVSGFEFEIAEYLKNELEKVCHKVWINKHKSVIGCIKSEKENAKKIMIDAHLDQIGMMVKGIDDKGFVSFTNIGGIDERILPASEVFILGKEKVYGVIGAKPPHLLTKEDAEKNPQIKDMLIDIGMYKEEAEKVIEVGDAIIMKSEAVELLEDKVSSMALDNRAGIASVLYAIENLKSDYDVYVVFSSQEETGLQGGYTAAAEIQPDLAIVIDVTHGETPDVKDKAGVFPLGSGAVICRGPNLDYEKTLKLVEMAKENNIKFEIEVAEGSSGTNAWLMQTCRQGVPCVLISIPLRYMHTSVETVSIEDIEETGKLIGVALGGDILA